MEDFRTSNFIPSAPRSPGVSLDLTGPRPDGVIQGPATSAGDRLRDGRTRPMRILTDCPEKIGSWRPQSRLDPADLGLTFSKERALWQPWGAVRHSGRAKRPTRPPPASGRALIVVASAPGRLASSPSSTNWCARGLSLPGRSPASLCRARTFAGNAEDVGRASGQPSPDRGQSSRAGSRARQSVALTCSPPWRSSMGFRALAGAEHDGTIKWVNDILIEGRKVAGVLT